MIMTNKMIIVIQTLTTITIIIIIMIVIIILIIITNRITNKKIENAQLYAKNKFIIWSKKL